MTALSPDNSLLCEGRGSLAEGLDDSQPGPNGRSPTLDKEGDVPGSAGAAVSDSQKE